MQISKRALILYVAILDSTPSFPEDHASAQALLIGKWKHTAMVRVIDGSTLAPQKFDGTAVLEFKGDMTWQLTSPNNTSAGTYRWLESGELETTTLSSGLAIQLGAVSRKQIRVDSNRLNVITVEAAEEAAKLMSPPKPGVYRPTNIMVTSVFLRERLE